jgi:hypothetical protein
METAFVGPGILVAGAVVGALFAAILPTCLYLYVEPRGRAQWASATGAGGDGADGAARARPRAPGLVRASAWLSFAIGQLAIPWLFVPVVCAILVYLQVQLGVARPLGVAVTALVGVLALAQALVSLRLLPLGVRLLVGDARLSAGLAGRARTHAAISAAVLGGCGAVSWAVAAIPSFVHPWLGATLAWTALRPVMAYASVCLLHAVLLGRCARARWATKGEP